MAIRAEHDFADTPGEAESFLAADAAFRIQLDAVTPEGNEMRKTGQGVG